MRQLVNILAILISALPALWLSPALAASTFQTERAISTLEASHDGLAPGNTTWFVLSQELTAGWHVYWRNPGDTGLSLEMDWTLPEGFGAGDVLYPLPEAIRIGDFVNYGHHGSPLFLVPITVPQSAKPGDNVAIELSATWLICEEVCVPETGEFSLRLPIEENAAINVEAQARIDAARMGQPASFDGSASVYATPAGPLLELTGADAEALSSRDGNDIYFFPYAEGLIRPAAAQILQWRDGKLLIAIEGGDAYDAGDLETMGGVLASPKGQGPAFEIRADLNSGTAPFLPSTLSSSGGVQTTTSSTRQTGLLMLLALAFAGGIILNIMPCVFPILFVKAATLVGAGADHRDVMRRHGLLYGAGVVATFAAMGGLLLFLRAGGEQLGWGFHLQSPVVVALSAYVLFLVGLNLAGVFSIGEGIQNTGAGLAAMNGNAGAFFTGALAVCVAAPCIGPLLSAPVGAAVLLPPLQGMLIFLAMALGLALPYVVVSWSPRIASALPKPGAWMDVFKQALAFPVFAAAAYFIWVLAQQVPPGGLAVALSGLVVAALGAWLFELSKSDGPRSTVLRAFSGLAILAVLVPAFRLETEGSSATLSKQAFDPQAIAAAQSAGEGVFVDFTAAWCVTCQVNKATIFSGSSFETLLADNNVRLMTADWTRRDPLISETLERFGASGVPFYVYYPAGGGEAVVLSLPLSMSDIRRAIEG